MTSVAPSRAFAVRPAVPSDALVIAGHRVAMFRDMGVVPPAGDVAGDRAEEALREATRAYLSTAMTDGSYAGWLAVSAEAPDLVVGGAGVQLRPIVPRPGSEGTALVAPQALILNVYTEPAWRRAGVAARLMHEALAWAEARGASGVVLHASADGRALYERLGFRPTNEMRFRGAPYGHFLQPGPT